jgi:D-lactate dehydrogenase
MFNSKKYEVEHFKQALDKSASKDIEFEYIEPALDLKTVDLAKDYEAICIFVNDHCGADVIEKLNTFGIKLILLRCAGFNNVDLDACKKYGIKVARVPKYSPYAVAEHAMSLILTLNRKTHKAYNRVREGNFALAGLEGFDIHGLNVGLIGYGAIGECMANILNGFGAKVLVADPYLKKEPENVTKVELDELVSKSDIISLHCPLTPDTHHMIDEKLIAQMKTGVMLINTSRGALIDTKAAIQALKSKKIAYLGIDVYEEEAGIFFEDVSDKIIDDDQLTRLLSFPNVLVTGHQAFLTRNALLNIAGTTIKNFAEFIDGSELENAVD